MDQNSPKCEELEIDLSQYLKMFAKRKKTFIAVVLLFLSIGLVIIQFSPKMYRTSMLIQPPVVEELLIGVKDIESAGEQQAMETAFQCVRNKGGLCIITGNLPQGVKISLNPFNLISGKRIIGTWGARRNQTGMCLFTWIYS